MKLFPTPGTTRTRAGRASEIEAPFDPRRLAPSALFMLPFPRPGTLTTPAGRSAWTFAPFLDPTPRPPYVAPRFRDAIGIRLSQSRAIAAIVGPRVYWQAIGAEGEWPALTYQVISTARPGDLDGPDGTADRIVQLAATSKEGSDLNALADVIRDEWNGFTGTVNGIEFLDVIVSSETETWEAPQEGTDLGATRLIVELTIHHREPIPTPRR